MAVLEIFIRIAQRIKIPKIEPDTEKCGLNLYFKCVKPGPKRYTRPCTTYFGANTGLYHYPQMAAICSG
jgi:hypothetical protein